MSAVDSSAVDLNAVDGILGTAASLILVTRFAVAWTESRLRAAGWPLMCCGPVVLALLLHDVAVGWVALAGLGTLSRWIVAGLALPDVAGRLVAGACALASIVLSEVLLRRRRGIDLLVFLRPRHRVAEPVPTLRRRLLDTVELVGARGTARWIDNRLNAGLDRNGGGAEQLLQALWPGIRLQLREAPGLPRTEVGLLLLQAQSIIDDASPERERMLTLLHLVHERVGRRGVHAALEQARRSPVRHGRSGAAAWAASPEAVPCPVAVAPS